MNVMDIDAGSFKDWLAQIEHAGGHAGSARSSAHCPIALYLDEIEGGEHLVSPDAAGNPMAGLSRYSPPTARFEPGQYRPMADWARSFTREVDGLKEGVRGKVDVPGQQARRILEEVLRDESIG